MALLYVCVYIFLRVFSILLYFLFSVSWLESKGNVCTTVNTVQFRKDVCFFFFKKKGKLTLTVLLNVYVSLVLLTIKELVTQWRVSREVYKY